MAHRKDPQRIPAHEIFFYGSLLMFSLMGLVSTYEFYLSTVFVQICFLIRPFFFLSSFLSGMVCLFHYVRNRRRIRQMLKPNVQPQSTEPS